MIPASVPLVPLSGEQQAAADQILAHPDRNFILTGCAGSGKSTVITWLRRNSPVFVCAMTGRAAVNVEGCTLDTLFCLNRNTAQVWSEGVLQQHMQLIPDRIVIDEASMLGDRLAPVVERIARDYRKQLILVGDFAQAVPVKEGRGVSTSLFQQAERLNLTECHRQTDRDYLDALNEARLGEVSEKTRQLFLSRVGRPEQEDRVMHFFATNRMSDAHNTTRLSQVKGAPALLTATYNDLRPMHKRMKSPLHPFKVTAAIDASPMAHNLRIKVGARVMMTLNSYADPDVANVDRETNWVNGDLGTIEDVLLDKDELLSQRKIASLGSPANNPVVKLIRVRLDRKPDQVVIVGPHVMPTYEVDKDPTGEVVGFPVTLGYSCTVHKSQGLTLDQAYIDMKSITFMPLESRHGLAYVALSRTRTLGGLYLSDWVDQAVYCDPELKGFIR